MWYVILRYTDINGATKEKRVSTRCSKKSDAELKIGDIVLQYEGLEKASATPDIMAYEFFARWKEKQKNCVQLSTYNTSERINEVLESQEEIEKRVYQFPTSYVKLNGKKSSYYEVINSLQFEECNKAILRIVPRIDFGKIEKMIDGIEGIDKLRKTFYKTMYRKRYELILKPAYEKLAE